MSADVAGHLALRLPHLYAVVDGASGFGAYDWLKHAGLQYQCLFQGDKAKQLAEEAPYLLHFAGDRDRLEELTALLWECQGGVFIESRRPFYAVRRQLRRFLLVKDEAGEVLFFRYYDPRVAAPFLPTCDATQIPIVFGRTIDAILYCDDLLGGLVEARATINGESRVETRRVCEA